MASPRTEDSPVQPLPSTTIALLRDGAAGIEVFTVTRNRNIEFASGALVFPGGKLEDADGDPALLERCAGLGGLAPEQAALRVCGIRETFEEAGILLARAAGTEELLDGDRTAELARRYRDDLNAGQVTLREMAEREELVLALDALTRFAHWITPDIFPKRFSTQFFMARAPDRQLGSHDRVEGVDSDWITPAQALDDEREQRRRIVFATRLILGRLGESTTVAAALEAARTTPVYTVTPVVTRTEDGRVFRIPKEAGYGIEEIHERNGTLAMANPKRN